MPPLLGQESRQSVHHPLENTSFGSDLLCGGSVWLLVPYSELALWRNSKQKVGVHSCPYLEIPPRRKSLNRGGREDKAMPLSTKGCDGESLKISSEFRFQLTVQKLDV